MLLSEDWVERNIEGAIVCPLTGVYGAISMGGDVYTTLPRPYAPGRGWLYPRTRPRVEKVCKSIIFGQKKKLHFDHNIIKKIFFSYFCFERKFAVLFF